VRVSGTTADSGDDEGGYDEKRETMAWHADDQVRRKS
jgi:hypothetical protein